jgi:OmpA-OmpF porin, OOP family
MRFPLAVVISGVLLAAASQANAADRGWFAGVGIGQMNTEIDDILGSGVKFDETDTAFKVFGGYKFFPWLSVEGAYVDGGKPEISESITDGSSTADLKLSVEVQSLVAAAVFTWPISDRFELFAKPGVAFWTSTTDVNVTQDGSSVYSSNQDDDGTAFFLGAGGAFNFNEHMGVRVEYEWFDVAATYDDVNNEWVDSVDATSGLWSASFVYSF